MRLSKVALTAMIAGACLGGTVFGQENRTVPRYYPASYYSYSDEAEAPSAPEPAASASDSVGHSSNGGSSSCCSNSSSCDNIGGIWNGSYNNNGCDSFGGCGLASSCQPTSFCNAIFGGGDMSQPWKLFPNGLAGVDVGGWSSVGYHSHQNPGSFNTYDGNVQLGQQWLYAEKVADGSCGVGFGGRIDYVYGTDAPDTQAFGNPGYWDTTWDNGGHYGHALPQVYGEVAYGDLSVKLGHFYTIIGNEVVQSTGNFFYSRQFTFYNAEPFTHTGALASYKLSDNTTVYGGYVLGWDSGFQDNGDSFISGISHQLSDDLSVTYTNGFGRFNDRAVNRENGYIHSVILTANLTEKLTYITQADLLFTRDQAGVANRNTFGNIHYLLYQVNDRVAFGQRFEWFNFDGQTFGVRNDDVYNYTLGLNYRHTANLTLRPEVRTVWDKENFGFNENNSGSQTSFGGDVIFTF